MDKFADRIRVLRRQQGFSQAELAANLGISRASYASYENGRRFPSSDVLIDMARYFNVSVDHLLGNDPKPLELEDLIPSTAYDISIQMQIIKTYLENESVPVCYAGTVLNHQARQVLRFLADAFIGSADELIDGSGIGPEPE